VHGNKAAEELSTEDLHDENNDPDDHECWIREYAVENIDLVIDFSSTDHIEDLHEDEEVEDNS
jgi:hypothetical protein